jgi:transglutaminase-like putative cysteine protease
MRYQVDHSTTYSYSEPVPMCQNEIYLTPRATARQACVASRLTICPVPRKLDEFRDYFGNEAHFFTIADAHREMSVTAHSEVSIVPAEYLDPQATPPWEQVRDSIRAARDDEALAARQFMFDSPHVASSQPLTALAAESFPAGRAWLEAVLDLTLRIHREFAYDPSATSVSTPLDALLTMRRGVCQDFAHLQIGCLRSLGLAARYVSGYLLTTPLDGQPRLIGANASHAWLSAWCPGLGWVEFDPTNNVVPSLDHITLAWGRDYSDVCPIKGVFVGGGHHSMHVAVDVRPVETPDGA